MRVFSHRTVMCFILALAGLTVSACSGLDRPPSLVSASDAGILTENQSDRGIESRLARVWMRVARQALEDDDPATAARFFRKASQSAPESVRPMLGLASAHDRRGDHEQAAHAFRAALKIDPENRVARVSLSNLLVAHGKIDEGIEYLTPVKASLQVASSDISRKPNAAPRQSNDQVPQKSPDLFDRIAEFFKTDDAGDVRSGKPTAAAVPAPQKVVIPATTEQAVSPPPTTDIVKTLNKLAPAAGVGSTIEPAQTDGATPVRLPSSAARPGQDANAVDPHPTASNTRSAKMALRTAVAGAPATGVSQYKIQLAAYRHLKTAIRGKKTLAGILPTRFPDMAVFVRQQQYAGGLRTNYRLRSRETTSQTRASALCRQAKSAGLDCLVIRQTASYWRLVDAKTISHAALTPPAGGDRAKGEPRSGESRGSAATVRPTVAAEHDPSGSPGYRIQLAAYRHLENAIRGRRLLSRLLPKDFPGLDILESSATARGAAPIAFRIRSSTPWSKSHAQKFCKSARSTGVSCLLIRHGARSWRTVALEHPSHAALGDNSPAMANRANRTHLIATR